MRMLISGCMGSAVRKRCDLRRSEDRPELHLLRLQFSSQSRQECADCPSRRQDRGAFALSGHASGPRRENLPHRTADNRGDPLFERL